jgi:uncharacterized protein
MHILFVSDLHFQRHWYEWIDRQSDHEVCVIAGDLLHALEPFHTDLRSQAAWVSGWLRGHRSALVVCAGNHDVFDDGRWLQQARTPNVSVDGDLRKLDDVTFASVGWRRDNWPTGADIIVVHEPPMGQAVAFCEMGDLGSADVADAVDVFRPKLLLCGHAHHPAAWCSRLGQTWCLNPGCDLGAATPNRIVIDTNRKTMAWTSEDLGSRVVDL